MRPLLLTIGRNALTVAALLCVSACSGSRKADPPEPVAECLQYEHMLSSCFHRDASFASQENLLAKTEADRERIKAFCVDNIQRLKTACR